MNHFPAFFDVKGRQVAIFGGGVLAQRKARLFRRAGADLVFVAPAFEAELKAEFDGQATFIERAFQPGDFEEPVLAVSACGDALEDESVAAAAKWAGVPVNVVDRPDLCDFITPSLIDRGDVLVAISTGGAAPVLGRDLRARIEALLPTRIGELARLARSFRDAVKSTIADEAQRRAFWERAFRGRFAERALAGDETGAREAMVTALNAPGAKDAATGVVHIIGAGPGDPELLTLKALRLLQDADVVLYDNLVDESVLDMARRDAERIYVGKRRANHSKPQEDINALMIRLAREGKRVARLKGGDPFVFGRGGEELEAVRAAGIEVSVVPGVTAAIGCAAEAGAPLTHRDYSQAVTFVTGHAKSGEAPDLDWSALAALKNTLVVYMGVATAPVIAERLIAHGRGADTPVAVIENGTRPDQIIAKGVLGRLPETMNDAGITGPAVLVIGEVAALAEGRGLVEWAQNQERLRA